MFIQPHSKFIDVSPGGKSNDSFHETEINTLAGRENGTIYNIYAYDFTSYFRSVTIRWPTLIFINMYTYYVDQTDEVYWRLFP